MRILITSIGSTTSIGVIKFVKALNRNIEIIGTDINPGNRIAGSSLVDSFFKVPLNTDPDYINEMIRIVKEKSVKIFIPIHDHEIEILSKETERFKNLDCKIIVSSFSTIKSVNNKYSFGKRLQDSNILTPATYRIEDWGKTGFQDSGFWILKPLRGVSSRGIFKGSIEEIRTLIEKNETFKSTYVIQKFIAGKEYTVDVFVKNKEAYCIIPRIRDEIREGICYKSYTVANEKFAEPVNNIIRLYDFYGPINIQFIESVDNKLYCIECNPRFGGSSVTSLYAGVNLFQFIIDDFEKKPLSFCNNYKNIYMTRYWEEIVYENQCNHI
jgi:carbamoyl-phosphate synthase large subunit